MDKQRYVLLSFAFWFLILLPVIGGGFYLWPWLLQFIVHFKMVWLVAGITVGCGVWALLVGIIGMALHEEAHS